ncbi:MAG: hypothetical protein K2G67_04235 [Muribaculaceae bacterium]|nr:hypothetical protein [Muribaculaceae bacterium]
MKQRLLFFFCLLTLSLSVSAHYTIHSVSGDVKVESGGKTLPATKGMTVNAIDYIVIAKGAKVEILNDLDKRIYTCITPGRTSVTKLMIAARGSAADNTSSVASRMTLGRKGGADNKNVYVEKGMVRRSLAVYDPDGDTMELDAETLGRFLAARILADPHDFSEESPVKFNCGRLENGGIGFKLENTMQFPIYLNVLRVSGGQSPVVEISQVGQPTGTYVVLPQQSLVREHFPPVPKDESHFIVMTNCQFDVDKVIEVINKNMKDSSESDSIDKDLPVYVASF